MYTKNDRVMIVTPTLGTRESIVKTYKSLFLCADEKLIRHVIVTPENRVDWCRERCPNSEVYADGGKKSIYSALNLAFCHYHRGEEWIGYLNDDDFWLPGMKKIFDSREANPRSDVIYGQANFVRLDGSLIRTSSRLHLPSQFPLLLAHGIIGFTQQAAIMRHRVFQSLDGFDESFRLVADTDFWARASLSGAVFRNVNAIAAGYCFHDGQLSAATDLQRDESIRLLKKNGLNIGIASVSAMLIFRALNFFCYLKRIFRLQR